MPHLLICCIVIATTLLAKSLAEHAGEVAHDERVVNVYSARHYDTDDKLYERFTTETGIHVNLVEGRSDALLARLKREGTLSPADVFITVDAARLRQALDAGVLQGIDSPKLRNRVPESLRDPEGRWFALTKRVRVIVAHKDRVPEGAVASYADLANPKWRGRVLVRSSSSVYNQSLVAALFEQIGPDAAQAWCEGVVANLARKPQGGDRDQIRAIAAGEGDIALVNHYYLARMLESDGPDAEAARSVRIIFPDQDPKASPDGLTGAHVNISGAGVLSTAPNRDHAIRFIEYLLSDEAQETLALGNNEYPVAPGVPLANVLDAFGSFRADETPVAAMAERNREAVMAMDRAGWR